jgi:hypothetical protein
MPDVSSRESCAYGVIMTQIAENRDEKLCDSLSETYKKECRISFISQEAMTSGNIEKCDAIKPLDIPTETGVRRNIAIDRVDQCKSDVIIRKPDSTPSDCDILSGTPKDMCVAIMKNRAEWAKIRSEESIAKSPNIQ